MRRFSFLALGGALVLVACAVDDLRPDYDAARDLVRQTTGLPDVLDPEQPLLDVEVIEAALEDGLGLEEAQRLALLNSRRLQAGFMGLGVARADWVQAGLLNNPSLGLAIFLPSGGGRSRLAADLAQDIMDIWRLPVRQHAAAAGYDQRVLGVAQLASELVLETRQTYLQVVAAREARELARAGEGLAQQSLAAGEQRLAGGVATEMDAALLRAAALSAELQARRAEREEALTTRRLGALLSLEADLRPVALNDSLPAPAPESLSVEDAIQRARTARLDLRASAAALVAAEALVELEHGRALPDVQVGLSVERPEGGSSTDVLAGPAATVELPIFDRNEAGIARAEARRDELRALHEAVLAEAMQQVRAAVDRADLAREAAEFVERQLLPQAERSLDLARVAYELGDITLPSLLEAQRATLVSRQALLDARLEAALSATEALASIGSPLVTTSPSAGGTAIWGKP